MKYRKKPVVIDVIQWTGDNWDEIKHFTPESVTLDCGTRNLKIPTLEGDHAAIPGDYIIKGVAGEFYPCKPDIFEQTYELVED